MGSILFPYAPPPLPTRCMSRYYGASTIYPGPTVFFFFHVTGCLVPVCLSVRLSVSTSLCSSQFCFSWFRFSSSLFPPTECICTKCRGSAHNIAFGLFFPYYFCISYIDQKGSRLPPFEYNFLAFPLLNDRTLYPTCLLFSHIAHIDIYTYIHTYIFIFSPVLTQFLPNFASRYAYVYNSIHLHLQIKELGNIDPNVSPTDRANKPPFRRQNTLDAGQPHLSITTAPGSLLQQILERGLHTCLSVCIYSTVPSQIDRAKRKTRSCRGSPRAGAPALSNCQMSRSINRQRPSRRTRRTVASRVP